MKKMLVMVLTVVMLISLVACGNAKDDKFVVGICQLTPHVALDAATQAFT